jgi:hypothetical protein
MFGRDYTPLGLFGFACVLGGVVLIVQTSGAIATVLSALVIGAGLVVCAVFFRLQTRLLQRRERPDAAPALSPADGRCGQRAGRPAGHLH